MHILYKYILYIRAGHVCVLCAHVVFKYIETSFSIQSIYIPASIKKKYIYTYTYTFMHMDSVAGTDQSDSHDGRGQLGNHGGVDSQ